MRIAAAEVELAARHRATVREEEHATLRVSVGAAASPAATARAADGRSADRVDLSELAQAQASAAREAVAVAAEACAESAAAVESLDADEEASEDPKLRLFRLVVEALTGTTIRPAKLDVGGAAGCGEPESPAARERADESAERSAGYSLEYDYAREYRESEHTSVAATGVITTADGKQIEFAVQVEMQREYRESTTESLRMGDAAKLKDPLFLHFDGDAGQLQQGTFAFDLDADGSLDNVHFAPPSSAALALDRNGNGKVDDGSELFGTASGDGFAELAQHDADKNGWIDEADPAFGELRLWSRSEDGRSRLSTLGERGVGAIYLGRVSSPYQIKDASNRLQGLVRSTGVWVGEDGKAGAAQQIDLAV